MYNIQCLSESAAEEMTGASWVEVEGLIMLVEGIGSSLGMGWISSLC
jgi:hypothetical protein